MKFGYFCRVFAWTAFVTVSLTAIALWFTRTVPAQLEKPATQAAPKDVAGPRSAAPPRTGDAFPVLVRYVDQPLDWIRQSWLFLGVAAFLVLAAWDWTGRSLGVYDLIHAESRGLRVLHGLALGLALGNALFVAYVTRMDEVPWRIDSERTLFPVDRTIGLPGEADAIRRSGNFLLATWVPGVVMIAASGIYRRRTGLATDFFPGLELGLFLSVAAVVGFVWVGWEILADGPLPPEWRRWYAHTPGAADGRIPPADYPMHLIATVFTLLPALLILANLAATLLGRTGSPVWVVCISLWLFTSMYGFVSFHFAGLQTVLLVIVGVTLLMANARHPFKLSLPNMEPEYAAARQDEPTVLGVTESPTGSAPVPLLSAEALLGGFCERWKRAGGAGKPRLIVMCTSGGGIRSSVWTAAVLEGLERKLGPRFRDHLRLITGASGGMVAAALYAGSRVHALGGNDSLTDVLAKDCLWPTWQGLFFADLPNAFLPFYRQWDRGRSLEESWRRNAPPAQANNKSPMSATFGELLPLEREGLAPSVVFSPMLVEDGRVLLISNLDLSDLSSHFAATLIGGPNGQSAPLQRISQPAVEFFRLFPRSHERFQVCTAARLSATFPYVTPTVSLPTAPPRRVVDAGFFDNYGVGIAAGWLLQHREAIRRYCSGVAILEVRAFPLEAEKTGLPTDFAEVRRVRGGLLATALAGISTPFEALQVIRSAGAYYRNDQLLHTLDNEFNQGDSDPFLVRLPIECPGEGSLSWAMTRRDRDGLIACFEEAAVSPSDPTKGIVPALRSWFGNGGT